MTLRTLCLPLGRSCVAARSRTSFHPSGRWTSFHRRPMTHNDPKLTRTDAAWLDAHWMPFTGNRQFKAHPRMLVAAEGAYYTDADGRKILDGLSGLWCTGLGHGRREITEALARQ